MSDEPVKRGPGRPKKAKNAPGICKLALCGEVSLGSRYFRLCQKHYDADSGGDRGECTRKGCKQPRILPYADGLCGEHHPGAKAMTSHEKILIEGALAGRTTKQLAAQLDVAPATVNAKLNSPTMRAVVEKAAEKTGLTTEHIMQTLKDATGADKVMLGRDEVGAPVPVECGPDWDTRLRASELGAKILGMNAPVKTETDVNTQQSVLVVLPAVKTIGLDHPVKVIEAKVAGE